MKISYIYSVVIMLSVIICITKEKAVAVDRDLGEVIFDPEDKVAYSFESDPYCTVGAVHGLAPERGMNYLLRDIKACTSTSRIFDVDNLKGIVEAYNSLDDDKEILLLNSELDQMHHNDYKVEGALHEITHLVQKKVDTSGLGQFSTTTGTFKLLLVRVIGTGEADFLRQSEVGIYEDFFTKPNNLRTNYRKCTKSQVTFDPADGENVFNGVITVNLNMDLRSLDFISASTRAIEILSDYNINYTHRSFIMPNTVDFRGAAAYGRQPGETTWFLTDYASSVFVQMHELAHNIGWAHSGKNGDNYGDPTCTLGNAGNWLSDNQVAICFNGAKTYHGNWFPEYYTTVIPSRAAYETELVGLNDILTLNNIPTTNNLVVQVMENGEAPLFVMYQKAEGVLDALSNSRDTITVTQQESFNSQSWSLAELKAGESFKYSNWGGYGEDKVLVIKVCSTSVQNNVDSSSVVIYMEGFTTASCQPIVTDPPTDPPTVTPQNDSGGCKDTPLRFLAGGKRRRCGWAKWNPQKRCGFWGVPSMCPLTCGVCPMCSDGQKKFILENGRLKSCWWVRNKNTMKRCQRQGVAETCRKTCGQCS